jgi:hypothetical protein
MPNIPSILKSFLVCVLLLGAVSCKKKYPDGPLLSFTSKFKRVVGTWQLSAAVINGEGKMTYTGFATCLLQMTDNKEYSVQWEERNQEMNTLGTWQWVDRKKYLRFSTDLWFYKIDADHNLTHNTYNNSQLTNTTYRITRLTEDQLWLENTTENGDQVVLHFKTAE